MKISRKIPWVFAACDTVLSYTAEIKEETGEVRVDCWEVISEFGQDFSDLANYHHVLDRVKEDLSD